MRRWHVPARAGRRDRLRLPDRRQEPALRREGSRRRTSFATGSRSPLRRDPSARGQGPRDELLVRRGSRAGRPRRLVRGGSRRDGRARRGVRLRQERHGAFDHGPLAAHRPNRRGLDPARGQGARRRLEASAVPGPRRAHRDGLPGLDDEPQPAAHGRAPDHGEPRRASEHVEGRRAAPRGGAARGGRRAGAGAPPLAVSAPALRRAAPTRRSRDRARAEPGALDRRRADDGARRHDPGAAARAAPARASAARHGADPDHARPRGRRGHGRPPFRDVRGTDRRGGADRGGVRGAPPPLHAGPAAERAPDRRAAREPARVDPRRAAADLGPARGLSLPAEVHVRVRSLRATTRRSRETGADGQAAACWADVREAVR